MSLVENKEKLMTEHHFPEVVRETTHQGQVVWLQSSPKEKEEKDKEVLTSSPQPLSPED